MDTNQYKRLFSLLENEIINTKISFSLQLLFFCFPEILALQWGSFGLLVEWQMMMALQLLFFCFSEILALQWGSFGLLVEWQMMMETRP